MTTQRISSVPNGEIDLSLTRVSQGKYRVIKCGEAAALYLLQEGTQREYRAVKLGEILEIPQHVNRFWSAISDCVVERVPSQRAGEIFLKNTLDQGTFHAVRENEDGSIDYLLGVGIARTTDGWVTLAKDLVEKVQWN